MAPATGQDNVKVMMKPFSCNQLVKHLCFLGCKGKSFPAGWDVQQCGDWHAYSAGGKAKGNNCSGEQFGNT